jgi:hypothetical protein
MAISKVRSSSSARVPKICRITAEEVVLVV